MSETLPLIFVNHTAVLVTAILAVAVASVWFSPLLFGGLWLRETGRTQSQEEDVIYIVRTTILSIFGYYIFFYAIGYVVHVATALGYTFPMIIGTLSSIAIIPSILFYGKREHSIPFIVISVAYLLCVLIGGSTVLLFWPW